MTISRREFMAGGCAAAAGLPLLRVAAGRVADDRPLIVSTWPFALGGNERAREVIQAGGSALDGVEQGIRVVDSIGNGSVGLSGGLNAAGYVQQDACIMNGPGHQAGSVAAIEGIVHPISAARRVMEHTKHVMLVGEGSRRFAVDIGAELCRTDELLIGRERDRYLRIRAGESELVDDEFGKAPPDGKSMGTVGAAPARRHGQSLGIDQ